MHTWQHWVGIVTLTLSITSAFLIWNLDFFKAAITKATNKEVSSGSENTITLLFVGFAISVAVGALVYLIIAHGLEAWRPKSRFKLMWLWNPLIAVSTGLFAGMALFAGGRFSISLGKVAYASLLNVPIDLKIGPGEGWLPPKIASVKTEASTAKNISIPKQTHITGDGVNVEWVGSALWEIQDAALAQTIDSASIPGFITSELIDAGRGYILGQTAGIAPVIAPTMPAEDASAMLARIATFKGSFKGEGGEAIHEEANRRIASKGLHISKFQIEDVSFSEAIEKALNDILKELFEAASLTKDARNKAAAVRALMSIFTENGVDMKGLSPEGAAELVDRMVDRAFLNEGKGSMQRITFGGKPPPGVLIQPEKTT